MRLASQRRVKHTSSVIRRNVFSVRQAAKLRETCLLRFTKSHGFVQEAFIHAPEPCEAYFIMDVGALYDVE